MEGENIQLILILMCNLTNVYVDAQKYLETIYLNPYAHRAAL